MKATLKNGVVIEGTQGEIESAIKKFGAAGIEGLEELYYKSSKGEMLLISDLGTDHLKNAIAKKYHEWAGNLRGSTFSPKSFLTVLTRGPQDKNLLAMIAELSRR